MNGDHERTRLIRHAVRVLPISPTRQVLLLQCVRPGAPDAPFWVTVGGGLEAGEDEREAAVRELWEETGIRVDLHDLRGPLASEFVEFAWALFDIEQHQTYYIVDVENTAVTFAHLEEVEVATTLAYRWWSLDDLRGTTEHVLDNQREIIENALAGLG
jgi:8-oxo-dGTP pyrophosphatase MutT (NUDIX family)